MSNLKHRYPVPGKLVDIGGYALHLLDRGEGDPPVVVDAGCGNCSLDWMEIQAEVAKLTRIITYDRAGYGWSDPGPAPRTSFHLAEELHSALVTAEIPGPYVLVGHSFGGFTMRIFAHQYPELTAGMVLIDAPHEAGPSRFPKAYTKVRARRDMVMRTMPVLARSGLLRQLSRFAPQVEQFPEKLRKMYRRHFSDPSTWNTGISELRAFDQSATQVRLTKSLGDIPLVVLTAAKSIAAFEPGEFPKNYPLDETRRTWLLLQSELATLSQRGEHVIAEASSHSVHLDEPGLVVDAIAHVVKTVRNDRKADSTDSFSFR